jgi:putative membrane protein
MTRKLILKSGSALAATGFVVVSSAFGQDMKQADKAFARDAAMGGIEEVELGKIAVRNGHSDQVKQFGQRMIDDHRKANDQLKSIAEKDNIALPSALDAQKQAKVDRFKRMTGVAFDRAYMRDMLKDHEMDVAAFRKEADSGMNPNLKDFAGSTLPTLQDHLRQAKEDNSAVMSRK